MDDNEIVSEEVLQVMGISEAVLEEVVCIVGRRPKIDELGTLLAMWEANGRQQSLLGWLRGQRHTTERHDYLYAGGDALHKEIREPRVRECVDLAHRLMETISLPAGEHYQVQQGSLLYMVGDVSSVFLGSDYAVSCLHLSDTPMDFADDSERREYTDMILSALRDNAIVTDWRTIGEGGLFAALTAFCGGADGHRYGFDVLTCREVRLDAFLFGEEPGRYVLALAEENDNLFVEKFNEAGLNCCFLGRATKGRVLIDGMDFGDISEFQSTQDKK